MLCDCCISWVSLLILTQYHPHLTLAWKLLLKVSVKVFLEVLIVLALVWIRS